MGGHWNGSGHQASTFLASSHDPSAEISQDDAEAFFALQFEVYMASGSKLPFAEWVKNAKCHECGKLGHIRPACPKRGGRRSKFNKWRCNTSGDKKDAKDKTKDEMTKERKLGARTLRAQERVHQRAAG